MLDGSFSQLIIIGKPKALNTLLPGTVSMHHIY